MDAPAERQPPFNVARLLLNCLTLIILLATLGVGVLFAFLFINPYSPINPYPPPTLPPTLGPPTPTNTPEIFLPPTWTQTPVPTATFTPPPTSTPEPTATPGVSPTPAPFGLQAGSPAGIPNIANNQGCDWMGVGGQVFDLNDAPIVASLTVHIEGELGGLPVDRDALTGSAPSLGPAGYVLNLADHPIASSGTLFVQLLDNAGAPLSESIAIDTFSSCDQNLILVNWKQR
jgi:hypothetical protein